MRVRLRLIQLILQFKSESEVTVTDDGDAYHTIIIAPWAKNQDTYSTVFCSILSVGPLMC